MKHRTAFTKTDFLVVLACIAFLLANIAAVGQGGRSRAKEALCLSNLMKWGQVFQAYTADNDGYFHSREVGTAQGYFQIWPYVYKPYYDDPMMRCCPTARIPVKTTGTFCPWSKLNGGNFGAFPMNPVEGEGIPLYGSYGLNRYILNLGGGFSSRTEFWRRAGVKGAAQVPVFMDCMYVTFFAESDAEPPEYDGDYTYPEMNFITINRHNGFINVCFMDWSARKVGLKELRTLKFNRTFDTCDIYTICGNGGNEAACAALWDAQAPWMSDFPEY